MLILSYENEFNLHVNEISFSYERMSTKTRPEVEAKGNSEMAYLVPRAHVSFGQRQDTELWNNPFQQSKILGLPVSRHMRALV